MEDYISLGKIKYRIVSNDYKGPCVLYVAGTFMENDIGAMYNAIQSKLEEKDFILCEVQVEDWDTYLTPWKADGAMKGRCFEGKAREILGDIQDKLLPLLITTYVDIIDFYIAGYSLAGLFSLWSLYESDIFAGAACCSGSLWYPGWDEYARSHSLKRRQRIYLSLGNKEEKSRHPLMRLVGDRMREQYKLLKEDDLCSDVTLVWNEGGHFNNTVNRTAYGMEYLVSSNHGNA